jgi:hypothetical protein
MKGGREFAVAACSAAPSGREKMKMGTLSQGGARRSVGRLRFALGWNATALQAFANNAALLASFARGVAWQRPQEPLFRPRHGVEIGPGGAV